MESKLYLVKMHCYKQATSKQLQRFPSTSQCGYDLSFLQSEPLRKEIATFIQARAEEHSISTMYSEIFPYKQLCRFLNDKFPKAQSFSQFDTEKTLTSLKAWLLEHGYKISGQKFRKDSGKYVATEVGAVAYLRKVLLYFSPKDNRLEVEKDTWELENLGISLQMNPTKVVKTIDFSFISHELMRTEAKRAILLELSCKKVDTVKAELHSLKRFIRFLGNKYPEIRSFRELNRECIEEYLLYLKTEVRKKSFRTELIYLRTLIEEISKVFDSPDMQQLFLSSDIPRDRRVLYRYYSDSELKRLNREIIKMDEQIARALILHEMLGTRISDTLTLAVDCLFRKDGKPYIRIDSVKGHQYSKPVSEDVVKRVTKAIQYTRKRYGETHYIFVKKDDTERPMTYSRIYYQIASMIHEKNLRDDNGNLFGVGTHMFRHNYGRKLTEMHVDDLTISKLLGHADMQTVSNYRRLSNEQLAAESLEMRQSMDTLLKEIIGGWEGYEQVRQNGG